LKIRGRVQVHAFWYNASISVLFSRELGGVFAAAKLTADISKVLKANTNAIATLTIPNTSSSE